MPPLDDDHLRDLITDGTPAASDDGPVREIGRASAVDAEALARAAVAAIEAERGPKRKYSTDERPADVVIRRRRTSLVVLALLAVIAVFAWRRALHRPPPVPSDPVELVAVLSPAAAASPALAPDWDAVRGVSDSLSERGRAMRIGALLVELERAWVRNDSSTAAPGDAVAALLAEQPDGAEVGARFAGGTPDSRAPSARQALAPLVRAAPEGVGAWLQAARVAAAMGDAGFFASARSKESLQLLRETPGVSADVQTARNRLTELLSRRGRPDFAAVASVLELLQRELAN